MRRRLPGAVFCTVAVSLLFAACTARRPAAPRAAPAILPSVADLEAVLQTRRDSVRSLRALAVLRYRDREESNTSREAIVVARPDRLRVEVLSLLGSVFVLTADNGALSAYARQDGTVYRGSASPENLWRYARLDLPVSEVVALVLGTPPGPVGGRAQVSFDETVGWIELSQPSPAGAQVVWFSDPLLPVAAARRDPAGQIEWRATFSDYEEYAGIAIATHIAIEWPTWQRSMEVRLQDVEVNPVLAASVFALQTPPGSKVVQLDPVAD